MIKQTEQLYLVLWEICEHEVKLYVKIFQIGISRRLKDNGEISKAR